MAKVEWSNLPEDLVYLIANSLSSNLDLLRFLSICKTWRSAAATKKRFKNHFQRNFPTFKDKKTIVSPTTFFRVTLPSLCPNKGWLIKRRQVSESSENKLLSPLSGQPIERSRKTLDLLQFGVSEIRRSYIVQYWIKHNEDDIWGPFFGDHKHNEDDIWGPSFGDHSHYFFLTDSARVVFLDNMFFAIDFENEIWCCKIGEESRFWTRIHNKEAKGFLDIILHKGKIYALDLTGAIWWISLSDFGIYQYGPPTPMDNYEIDNNWKEKRLVEYCGDLYVVHQFSKKFHLKRVDEINRTVGFKVYKMDNNLVQWVEVSSLGNKALIMASDSCFMVLASEYYGCLENAIYFNDEIDDRVFKLDDGSIVTEQIDFSSSSSDQQSCFDMFYTEYMIDMYSTSRTSYFSPESGVD